jgi:DNA-binding NtrC family response regulator
LLRQDEDINILLTDLGLPGMSGRDLMAEALKLKPGLKVIVASGYSNPTDLPAGVMNLIKPFDMQQLRKVLES